MGWGYMDSIWDVYGKYMERIFSVENEYAGKGVN
jgi:hypothetical protein